MRLVIRPGRAAGAGRGTEARSGDRAGGRTRDGERWAAVGVVEYRDCYEVSDLGRVRRSAPGRGAHPGKVLAATPAPGGHPVVKLTSVGVARGFSLAPLVAAAFLPAGPPGWILKHRDGDRSNCAAANLEWRPRDLERRKLSVEREAEVRCLLGVAPAREVAQRYGVCDSTVRAIWKARKRTRRRPAPP